MRRIVLFVFTVLLSIPFYAQADDPVVMTVNGYDVKKSEFEYFFKKNNTDSVITGKTVKQYADLYLNFKLKVQAAIDAGMDKAESFLNEYKMYRDMQAEDYLTDNAFIDEIAHEAYEKTYNDVGPDGLVYLLIISSIPEDETDEAKNACMERMFSIYEKLKAGEDFQTMSQEYADDDFISFDDLGWMMRSQMPGEIGDMVFDMRPGQLSDPFMIDETAVMFRVESRRVIGSFESESAEIYEWIHNRTDIDKEAKVRKGNEYASRMGWDIDGLEALARADSLLEEIEPEFGNISREYHDGLLLFEISSKEIWEKANDSEAVRNWFDANKKLLSYEKPCFKGMVFFCQDEDVFNQIKKELEGVELSEWVNKAVEFNKESVKLRVMRGPSGSGIFLKGQNAYVDKIVFNTGEYEPMKGFPYVNVIGKVIKKPETMDDVAGQVTDAYQNYLEQEWIKKLRKQYKYKIYNKALKKVSLNK